MCAVPYVVNSVSKEQELQAILGHVLLLQMTTNLNKQ